MAHSSETCFELRMKAGRCMLRFKGRAEETAVNAKWLQPLSGRGGAVTFVDAKKREVAMTEDLACLDRDSRAVAEEALGQAYLVTRITHVRQTRTHFGTRFWEVDTDRGPRTFAMRNPYANVTFADDNDRVIVRDTMGNCYEIESLADLDRHSRYQVEKVI